MKIRTTSDIHLDSCNIAKACHFVESFVGLVEHPDKECIVVSGDIANAGTLPQWMHLMGKKANCQVFYILLTAFPQMALKSSSQTSGSSGKAPS